MTEIHHIPTGQELDTLLGQQPQFDLDAVKRRTFSRITEEPGPSGTKRLPFRGILIAAVICILSISAVAAADYATEGRISTALGIRKEYAEPAPGPEPMPEAPPAQEVTPLLQPAEPPEPEPVEPPELDGQLAGVLQISQSQAQRLRPAVQAVEQTAEDRDIRMTVLQTLGDPSCLYVKLRFDFPEGSPLASIGQSKDLTRQFEHVDLTFEDMYSYSWSWFVLDSDETSVTYLLRISNASDRLNGQTATLSFENYGSPHMYTEDEVLHLIGEAGKPFTTIIRPDGSMLWDAAEEDVAALSAEVTAVPVSLPDGFTAERRADGSTVVSYDGLHGDQMADAYWVPGFDTVLEGKWEQSWTLSYQDTSLYWEGEASLFDPSLTMTSFRLSPLSWEGVFTTREPTGDDGAASALLYLHRWTLQLRRRDGSLTDISMEYGGGGWGEVEQDGDYTVTTMQYGSRFDQPIDLTDAVSIIIDGVEFPIS